MKRKHPKNARKRTKPSEKSGLSPGTPVFVGERKQTHTEVEVLKYAKDFVTETKSANLEHCTAGGVGNITWVNVFGVHDVEFISALCTRFGIHPLTQEDIVSTMQRPKAEEFDDYFFVVLKMMTYNDSTKGIDIETMSLVFGEGYVLSFQERAGDAFEPVRERIRTEKGRVRKAGADYLAYTLMDAVVDGYFVALERIGDHVETVEEELISNPTPAHMGEIHRLKREVIVLRKMVWPLREEIAVITKSESPLVRPGTRVYLRDVYDHTIRVVDMVETHRDILGSLHEIYLSSVSNRMNEVMKVLTIIATIFIPLTFVVGVYGMNFKHMPELEWRWGYFLVWGVMIALGVGMVAFFRKKQWL